MLTDREKSYGADVNEKCTLFIARFPEIFEPRLSINDFKQSVLSMQVDDTDKTEYIANFERLAGNCNMSNDEKLVAGYLSTSIPMFLGACEHLRTEGFKININKGNLDVWTKVSNLLQCTSYAEETAMMYAMFDFIRNALRAYLNITGKTEFEKHLYRLCAFIMTVIVSDIDYFTQSIPENENNSWVNVRQVMIDSSGKSDFTDSVKTEA